MKGQFMKFTWAWILGVSLLVFPAFGVRAHKAPAGDRKLADLLVEAEKNNPQIQAARHGWQSAKQIPSQVATLPDPQVVLQQTNVGSPRPFAGYTNSKLNRQRSHAIGTVLEISRTFSRHNSNARSS